jgi:hypothetical protein
MLCRFDDVFVVMHHGFKFLFYSVRDFGGEPDVGFKEVSQKFVRRIGLFLQVMEVSFV